MENIKGIYAEAKVFADDMTVNAKNQIQLICDNPVAERSRIRVMPDVHPGKVGPIGLTMTVGNRVIPYLLGVDIGCGIACVILKNKKIEMQKLDTVIRECVPSGFQVRRKVHHMAAEFETESLRCSRHIKQEKAKQSLGSLGGGNHFIEVDRDEEGTLYLIVHSGSRHLGVEVTEHYVSVGAKILKEKGLEVPYPMTWLEGKLMEDYIADLHTAQAYAQLNREIILAEIIKGMKWKEADRFSSVHNYIEEQHGELILRKGAASARKGEHVIIPVNMRDGVLLGTGKGNPDWNESAPHGSGRTIKRSDVKNQHTVSEFKNEMKGIYCSCINADTLDEAPFAYRSMDQMAASIQDTVEITNILKPIYNFKGGRE
ncbi:MAG: RtcB family protein [Eubacteriales bacterium]|nr:RtcB family protein [Eubacteriales bacterium]